MARRWHFAHNRPYRGRLGNACLRGKIEAGAATTMDIDGLRMRMTNLAALPDPWSMPRPPWRVTELNERAWVVSG